MPEKHTKVMKKFCKVVLNLHLEGGLDKGYGRGLVLFQYVFMTKIIIMPKNKSNHFGNPIPRAYFFSFITTS